MLRKDQIQQISEQIQKQTIKIGKVKPKYTKFISPPVNLIADDIKDPLDILWAKLWFVPTDTCYSDFIGPAEFNNWVNTYADMHFGSIITRGDGVFDGPVPQNAHIYYAIEVRSSTPKTLIITIDTAYGINILVNNISVLSGKKSTGHKQIVNVPGGDIWVPIEIYAINPFSADSSLNRLKIYMDLASTFGRENIRKQTPSAPINFNATNGNYTNRIELSWELSSIATDRDKIQIWRSSDNINWLPLVSVDGNIKSYSDRDVHEGDRFYYKARFIAYEGGVSSFTSIVTGIAGSVGAALDISLSANAYVGDFTTIGNYQSNETITATIRSNSPLFEDSIMVDLEYPTINGGYYRVPISEGLGTYIGSDTWKVDIVLSEVAASDYPLADGRAKIIAKGYIPGIEPDGWMGPAGTAGTVIGIKGFNIDNKAPQFSFFIDYDRRFSNEDTFTYSNNVALIINNLFDPATDAIGYHNPEGDEFEANFVDGVKYISGIYQIRYANSMEALTGLNMGVPITSWKNYSIVGNIIDPYYLDMDEQEETKYTYVQIRDMAGNVSEVVSDSIIYLDSLPVVQNLRAVEHYEYINLEWDPISGIASADGYYIYRNETGTTPLFTDPPYIIVGRELGGENLTIYNDKYPSAEPNTRYYYWVRAFIGEGQSPESYILSLGFSSYVYASLNNDPPNADTYVLGEGLREAVHIQFKSATAAINQEKKAKEHLIYRCPANVSPPVLASSKLIQTIGMAESDTIFDVYDASAELGSSYKYSSVARNGLWLNGTTYYTQTGTVNWSDALRIEDEPPYAPLWAQNLCNSGPWGISLAWINNRYQYPTHDDDVIGYALWCAPGNHISDNPLLVASGIAQVLCPIGTQYIHYPINAVNLPESECTFWLVAYDIHQSGAFSDPLLTGLTPAYPNKPLWASGYCYAGYGYNHLVWSGGGDDYGFQYGYKIYRAEYDKLNPPTSDTLLYATGTYNAKLVHSIIDQRSTAGTINFINDLIELSGWNKEYCYWLTAFNSYDYESSAALLTGLDFVKPDFSSYYHNYLDNGSFEREFQYGTWEFMAPEISVYLVTGVHKCTVSLGNIGPKFGDVHVHLRAHGDYVAFNHFKYEYAFVQGNKDYCLSMYCYRPVTWSVNTVSGGAYINWYGMAGNLISTSTLAFSGGSIYNPKNTLPGNDWYRMYNYFTSPVDAVRAEISIGFNNGTTTNYMHVDGVQWEVSGYGVPLDFVDSRNITANKMLANSVVADMIQAGSINAGHIQAETISSYHIRTESIDLDRLTVNPGLPRMRFTVDPHADGRWYHELELITTGGLPYISKDNGETWYEARFSDSVPAGWIYKSATLISGTDNNSEYYLYIESWPITSPAYIKVSSANTYPNPYVQILARMENKALNTPNGGYFVVHEWGGPGVSFDGSQIVAGTFHGKYIEAETISGTNIAGYSIQANKIAISQPYNMLKDGAFDILKIGSESDLQYWYRSSAVNLHSGQYRYTGKYSLKFSVNSSARYFYSVNNINTDEGYLIPLLRDKTYVLSYRCYVTSSADAISPKLELLDISGAAIDTALSSECRVYDEDLNYLGTNIPIDHFNEWVIVSWIIGPASDPNVSWTPTNYIGGSCENVYYVVVSPMGYNGDDWRTLYVDAVSLSPGSFVNNQYIAEKITTIEGDRIDTGTINCKYVTVESEDSKVVIDSKGITVGQDELGYNRTRLSDQTLTYIDENNDISYYDFKTLDCPGLSVYDPHHQKQIYIINKAFSGMPHVKTNLHSINPLYYNGQSYYLFGKFPGVFIPYRVSEPTLTLEYIVGSIDSITGYNEAVHGFMQPIYENNTTKFTNMSMYVKTGDYNNISLEGYRVQDIKNTTITYTGDKFDGAPCIYASYIVYVHGPCTGWTFGWRIQSFDLDGTWNTTPTRGYAFGYKTITLQDGETYKWEIPARCINTLWETDVGTNYALKKVMSSNYKTGIQLRLWTTQTNQAVVASGEIKQTYLSYANNIWGIKQMPYPPGSSLWNGHKYTSIGYVADVYLKE